MDSDPVGLHADGLHAESVALPGLSERSILDVLPRAIVVTAPDGRIVLWNRRAEALYGWSEAEVLGRHASDVLVALGDRAQGEAVRAAILTGESWQGDFTVLRRDGETLRVFVVDAPVVDADGTVVAIVGASEDVTEQRLTEQLAAELAEHLALALDAGELGTWRWDIATGETIWDTRLEALCGLGPGSFDGTFDAYVATLHPDDAASVLATVQRAVMEKTRYTVEHRIVWPDGTVRWIQGKGRVIVDDAGVVTGTMGCVSDVTAQVLAAEERERSIEQAQQSAAREHLSAQRLAFLGEINDALAASPTRTDVMRNVTRAAVPTLGDWCAIHVLVDGSAIPEMEVAHVDPSQVEYVKALQERFPYDPSATTGIPHIIRSGRTEFYPIITDQVLAEVDTTDEARDVVRSLGLRSAIAVPMLLGDRVLGALQFVNSATSRAYTDDDVALAQAVATRIASTLDNRRLAEQHRMVAATLQASLLPNSLPDIPGLECAVRYWAAGDNVEVGGDFYDLFDVDDHWAAVIGDVCGTGPTAASLTGLARHTIRAAAWNGAAPTDVLRQLNRAVYRSDRHTFCTAAYCTLSPMATGFRLSVTSGGHPLPIVRRADGRTETVGVPGTLLGAFPGIRTKTVTTELQRGDIAVLYTDGVTDVRPPHGLTPDDLATIVEHAGGATNVDVIATNLGRLIDEKLSFAERNDDIALLILSVP